MSSPNRTQEGRRFLGMCNQLSKFSSGLADKTKPIRDLLSDKTHWNWGIQQEEAFKEIKKILSNTPTVYWPYTIQKRRQRFAQMHLHMVWVQF